MKTAEQILLERVTNLEHNFTTGLASRVKTKTINVADSIDHAIQQCIKTPVCLIEEAGDFHVMKGCVKHKKKWAGYSDYCYRD